jgi:hypothetical protein
MLWKEQFILVASGTVEMGRQHTYATLTVYFTRNISKYYGSLTTVTEILRFRSLQIEEIF